jgi:SPX domain protein involved in polyphosphate accumulation
MRNEIKIPINKNFDLYFQNWKDFRNKITRPYKDRIINSVYYDTENFNSAKDNLAGISKRRKYRIRWYDNNDNIFNYEIKVKNNNLGNKFSLTSNDVKKKSEDLFSYKNEYLKKEENKFFLNQINSLDLKPKLRVSYLRSYYLYNKKIRITYDRKIDYSLLNRFHLNEFKKKDFMNVIEIKFEPENYNLASSLIKDSKFIPKRFSKYLRGLHLLGVANYI